ncbi:DUF1330 domain-containing protein [Rudaeicoccus suwonensis]|uniref:Uncharacterized protein (DUF1330 family) n=1 Tax=Rudaeicoccus suwonensis TaxID=657409 RepID=A0A561E7E8_9MICO|nr:DUF1330 domain-containing protein [Rudaeicoccus suwonensis]TWE11538.1 uncharacterized protein (DUF1330 family) [Rudaeicoccus suwonensis]
MTAKGYWIARVQVDDEDAYAQYVAAAGPAYAAYGGRLLVRGGRFEAAEGDSRPRNVVIEFDSYQMALDCYNSAAYASAREIRQRAADADIIVIEGYDGPQPTV